MTGDEPVSALVLGQVPPPFHGQAVMIATWLDGDHQGVEIEFLPMRYSRTVEEVGRFRVGKLIHLVRLIVQAVGRLVGGSVDAIYYPPAGAGRVPLLRDVVTLLAIRRFKRPVVYHFHAMGLRDSYHSLGRLARSAFRAAYFEPDLCICPASNNVEEIAFLRPKNTVVVPYGIDDTPPGRSEATPSRAQHTDVPRTVLFVGNLIPTKGVWRLLRLADRLGSSGRSARVVLIGEPPSADQMREYEGHPAVAQGRAVLTGGLFGEDKTAWLAAADLFCFPSTYESENFPVVLLEALRAGLPIVSTRWRGIPEIVEDGACGFLVDPDDEDALFERVGQLLDDEALRSRMARAARDRYLTHFTAGAYVKAMDRAVRAAARQDGARVL